MTSKQRSAALRNLKKARSARRKKSAIPRKRRRSRGKRGMRRSRARHSARPVMIVASSAPSRKRKSARRVKRSRRRMRKNPNFSTSFRSLTKISAWKRIFAVGGGVLGGTLLTSFLTTGMFPGSTMTLIPASVTGMLSKARPIHGVVHLMIGFYLQKKRNPMVKDIGLGVAAQGGYDILTQVLKLAGLNIPTLAGMNVSMLGMNVNPQATAPIVLQGDEPSMQDDLIAI